MNGGSYMFWSTTTFRILDDEIDLKTLRNAMEISKEKKDIGISQEQMEKLLNSAIELETIEYWLIFVILKLWYKYFQ